MGQSFRWDWKTWGLNSKQVWHDRIFLSVQRPWTQSISPNLAVPSPVMVTSPYKWKILKLDITQQIINYLCDYRKDIQACSNDWLKTIPIHTYCRGGGWVFTIVNSCVHLNNKTLNQCWVLNVNRNFTVEVYLTLLFYLWTLCVHIHVCL
jgi:hypothetical protein